MFPEFLYKLTPRDEQVTPLEVVTFRSSLDANSATVNSALYTVPLGKVLLLRTATVECDPVYGTTTCTSVRIDMYKDSSVPIVLGMQKNEYTGVIDAPAVLQNPVVVPEGWILKGVANYDVANAGNGIAFSMCGILIPRGNFAI